MNNVYFNILIDKELPHFCRAYLVGVSELSPDSRYCNGRYEDLLSEARLLPAKKRPKWIPRVKKDGDKAIQTSRHIELKVCYYL